MGTTTKHKAAEVDSGPETVERYELDALSTLEAESIHILREVAGDFERPVMLYSVGKDSSVMLRLAQKAFHPAKLPFPLLHVDTSYKFDEMITFRDRVCAALGVDLRVYTHEAAKTREANPWDLGTQRCCALLKTQALLAAYAATSDSHYGALGAALERLGGAAEAWDLLLTAIELRPSALPEDPFAPARLLARVGAGRIDALREALVVGAPGPWLRRQGVPAEGLMEAFEARVEWALILLDSAPERAAQRALDALADWEAVLLEIHGAVAAARGEEAAQATVERFLDPRGMAAYLPLPRRDLVKLALTTGRHLAVATLTARERPGLAAEPAVAAQVDEALDGRRRWARFFAAAQKGLDTGALSPRDLVFLWLAPAVGAGEAWLLSGGPPKRVGSANYARNKALETLGGLMGTGAPGKLPTPGKPDAEARGLVALLNLRRGADPCVDGRAGLPAQALAEAPPLDDAELLSLLRLFNEGPEGVAAPAQLLARALRHQDWDRRRRVVAAGAMSLDGEADPLRFLLSQRICGLAGEAQRWSEDPEVARAARAALLADWPGLSDAEGPADRGVWLAEALGVEAQAVEAWLQGGEAPTPAPPGPRNETLAALERLMRARRRAPTLQMPSGRPVERAARLQLGLEAAADG